MLNLRSLRSGTLTARCPAHALARRQAQRRAALVLATPSRSQVSIAVDPSQPSTSSAQVAPAGGPPTALVLLLGVGIGMGLSWIKKQLQFVFSQPPSLAGGKKPFEPLEYFDLHRADADPEAYQKALARSRQAQCINKAVAYMQSGDPARAVVELGRALQENCCCRSPLLDGSHPKAQLMDLYR